MKKLAFLAVAFVALSVVSCKNKTAETPVETDTTAVAAAAELSPEAQAVTDELAQQIEKGDANVVATGLSKATAMIQQLAANGDTSQVRQYANQLAAFVAEHKDKIQEYAKVNPAIEQVVNMISTPDQLNNLVNTALQAVSGGADAVKAATDAAAAAGVDVKAATEAATKAAADAGVDAKAATEAAAASAKNAAAGAAQKAAADAQQKANADAEQAQQKANDAVNKAKDALKF